MSDKFDIAASKETAGPWLSPSEALTRFVPGERGQSRANRGVAPIRFGFRVGNIGLLVPAGMLSELVEDTKVYRLPTTAPWFRGLINLRGDLVPVFDLKALFTSEDQTAESLNVLVLDAGARAVSVLIDGLPVTIDTGRRLDQSPPLPEMLRDHSRAVYVREREVWVDFDFDGFFRAVGDRIAV